MPTRRDALRTVALSIAGVAGCAGDGGDQTDAATATTGTAVPTTTPGTPAGGNLTLGAPFADGESVPTEYTCEGANASPPLSIGGAPGDTRTLALVVDDPDAPTDRPFVHWLLWNLPATTTRLPRDVPNDETVLDGARQGTNSAGSVGYTGPCPPRDDGPHTYRFTLSALDATLDVPAGARRDALESATAGHVVATARVRGTFDR